MSKKSKVNKKKISLVKKQARETPWKLYNSIIIIVLVEIFLFKSVK